MNWREKLATPRRDNAVDSPDGPPQSWLDRVISEKNVRRAFQEIAVSVNLLLFLFWAFVAVLVLYGMRRRSWGWPLEAGLARAGPTAGPHRHVTGG